MPKAGTPRRQRRRTAREEAVLRGGERHLGADHRPAVQRADAGDDDGERDEVAGPGAPRRSSSAAAEYDAWLASRASALAGRMPKTAIIDSR